MRIDGNSIHFEACDMPFVRRFGIEEATRMVGDFRSQHDLPFLYDTHQLSWFLSCPRDRLFALSRNPETAYYPMRVPKRNGDVREIHAPSAQLCNIQRTILRHILQNLPLSRYATAYRQGYSTKNNASCHCGKTYLLKMDIKDFFGSIRFDQIYRAAFHRGHFPVQIGAMLTSLCCYHERLPQGAPTSPMLSNLVMRHFDEAMGAWCDKRGIAYTRYSDDLTFSSDEPLYAAYVKAKAFLEDMGFEINCKKTCFVTRASKKVVTGLVVNGDTVTIPRDYRRSLRQELYYVEKYGVADAILRGGKEAFIEDGKPQMHRYLNHLEGRVLYVIKNMKGQTYFLNARRMLRDLRLALLQEEADK